MGPQKASGSPSSGHIPTLGLTPAQLVTVFLELHRGGYLQAKLEVR